MECLNRLCTSVCSTNYILNMIDLSYINLGSTSIRHVNVSSQCDRRCDVLLFDVKKAKLSTCIGDECSDKFYNNTMQLIQYSYLSWILSTKLILGDRPGEGSFEKTVVGG